MKLVIGEKDFKLGWRDGCFAVGVMLISTGLIISLGWGMMLAAVGILLCMLPYLSLGAAS